jgi:hypothetical protein
MFIPVTGIGDGASQLDSLNVSAAALVMNDDADVTKAPAHSGASHLIFAPRRLSIFVTQA